MVWADPKIYRAKHSHCRAFIESFQSGSSEKGKCYLFIYFPSLCWLVSIVLKGGNNGQKHEWIYKSKRLMIFTKEDIQMVNKHKEICLAC